MKTKGMEAVHAAEVVLDDVDVGYSGQRVVHAVSLELPRGQIGCLLGPSGCGKTTLLRAIAGFEGVMRGEIRLNDETVSRPGYTLAPEKRNVGMVFQDFALFPHLDVTGNIAFGIRRWNRGDRDRRVKDLLRLIGLSGYERAYPHALSGGQQQRVALARALAPKPQLLLLDEPFSSMDVELRTDLAREVRAILRAENTTGMLVTHDQNEAFAFADRIAVLNNGRLCQWDTAYHLYHKPTDRFVADFVGEGTIIPGRVCEDDCVECALGKIRGPLSSRFVPGTPVDILVRPDDLELDLASGEIPAEVTAKAFRGADFLYTLRLQDDTEILCVAPSHDNFIVSDHVRLRLNFSHLVVFPRGDSGAARR